MSSSAFDQAEAAFGLSIASAGDVNGDGFDDVVIGAYLAGPVAHCMECHTPMGPQGPMLDTALGQGLEELQNVRVDRD